MSKLYISEYSTPGLTGDASSPIALEPSITTQVVDYSSGVTSSQAWNDRTRLVLIKTDADCHISIGTAPTATTNHMPLWARESVYLGVGRGSKISVIGA